MISTCSICFEDVEYSFSLKCNHSFCEDCVCKWYVKNANCPMCRSEFSDRNIRYIKRRRIEKQIKVVNINYHKIFSSLIEEYIKSCDLFYDGLFDDMYDIVDEMSYLAKCLDGYMTMDEFRDIVKCIDEMCHFVINHKVNLNQLLLDSRTMAYYDNVMMFQFEEDNALINFIYKNIQVY